MAPTIIVAERKQINDIRPLTYCQDCDEVYEGHIDTCESCEEIGCDGDLFHRMGIWLDADTVLFVVED